MTRATSLKIPKDHSFFVFRFNTSSKMTTMNPQQASGYHHHHPRMNRFPLLLFSVLQDSLTDPELAEIISWEQSGTAFRIHDQKSCVEKVFPRYFPKMKSYRSFRRQLNLYGILIQNPPSRKFSFHVMSPSAKSGVASGETEPPRLSSGVYSHPILRQDRPDLAARIPRMAAAVPYPTPPLPPSRGHSGKTTFFIHDTTASGNSSTNTSTTITTDATLSSVRSNPESHNTADYYYSFYNNSNKSTTGSPSTPRRGMVSPETKSSTTFPPSIFLALDAEPATKSFFSLMNDIPSLIGLQQPHQQSLLDSTIVRHEEDIRLEIIRTFL